MTPFILYFNHKENLSAGEFSQIDQAINGLKTSVVLIRGTKKKPIREKLNLTNYIKIVE